MATVDRCDIKYQSKLGNDLPCLKTLISKKVPSGRSENYKPTKIFICKKEAELN